MFGQSKVDDAMLAELINMGFDSELSAKALLKSNNNLEKAIDFMSEPEHLIEPSLVKRASKDYSIMNLPHTKNQLVRMMLYICDRLDKSTRYCILCHNKLETESIKLRACTSEHCEFM